MLGSTYTYLKESIKNLMNKLFPPESPKPTYRTHDGQVGRGSKTKLSDIETVEKAKRRRSRRRSKKKEES